MWYFTRSCALHANFKRSNKICWLKMYRMCFSIFINSGIRCELLNNLSVILLLMVYKIFWKRPAKRKKNSFKMIYFNPNAPPLSWSVECKAPIAHNTNNKFIIHESSHSRSTREHNCLMPTFGLDCDIKNVNNIIIIFSDFVCDWGNGVYWDIFDHFHVQLITQLQ